MLRGYVLAPVIWMLYANDVQENARFPYFNNCYIEQNLNDCTKVWLLIFEKQVAGVQGEE